MVPGAEDPGGWHMPGWLGFSAPFWWLRRKKEALREKKDKEESKKGSLCKFADFRISNFVQNFAKVN